MHLTSPLNLLTFSLAAASAALCLTVPAAPPPPSAAALEPRDALERRDVTLSGCGNITVSQISGSTATVNGCLDVNGNWVTDGACARFFVYGNATGDWFTTDNDYCSFATTGLTTFGCTTYHVSLFRQLTGTTYLTANNYGHLFSAQAIPQGTQTIGVQGYNSGITVTFGYKQLAASKCN